MFNYALRHLKPPGFDLFYYFWPALSQGTDNVFKTYPTSDFCCYKPIRLFLFRYNSN